MAKVYQTNANSKKMGTVILASGKVYYSDPKAFAPK